MVRAHTLVGTAMFELLWQVLEEWLLRESAELDTIVKLDMVIDNFMEALVSADRDKAIEICASGDDSECITNVKQVIDQFKLLQCNTPTAKFWLMYIDMVNILKRFIYAERAGVWRQHLVEAEKCYHIML